MLTGIKEEKIDFETVTIDPNPAEHFIKINNPENEIIQLTIYDIMGKKVLENEIVNQTEIIHIEHLNNGVYMVDLNKSFKSKLIINR